MSMNSHSLIHRQDKSGYTVRRIYLEEFLIKDKALGFLECLIFVI